MHQSSLWIDSGRDDGSRWCYATCRCPRQLIPVAPDLTASHCPHKPHTIGLTGRSQPPPHQDHAALRTTKRGVAPSPLLGTAPDVGQEEVRRFAAPLDPALIAGGREGVGACKEAWEAKLATLRSYRRATGHLAPRQDAMWGEDDEMVPSGQHMANLRRKGAKNGLGKNEDTATTRAAQLAAIDKDWNCTWPLDWQRHYRVLADLVDADGALPHIAPGVVFDGDDIGKWLRQQKQPATWARLLPEQQERLTKLGVEPAQSPPPAPAAARGGRGQARRSRRSSAAWRRSRSGWSGKAWTGRCRAPMARRSRSRARRSRWW